MNNNHRIKTLRCQKRNYNPIYEIDYNFQGVFLIRSVWASESMGKCECVYLFACKNARARVYVNAPSRSPNGVSAWFVCSINMNETV